MSNRNTDLLYFFKLCVFHILVWYVLTCFIARPIYMKNIPCNLSRVKLIELATPNFAVICQSKVNVYT